MSWGEGILQEVIAQNENYLKERQFFTFFFLFVPLESKINWAVASLCLFRFVVENRLNFMINIKIDLLHAIIE